MRFFRHPLFTLFALTAISIFLRANNLNHGSSFHPDERHIVMTLGGMSWENLNPGFFAYGSFPFYLAFFVGKLLGYFDPWLEGYDGMFFVGRSLSVIFGTITVLLTYCLSLEVFKRKSAAIVAALLLSVNVFHIQLSRFFAFDMILTALCLATLISSLSLTRGRYKRGILLTGFFFGLALATKISALSLLAPIGMALLLSSPRFNFSLLKRTTGALSLICLIGAIVFCLTEPYALVDQRFISQNLEQINMTRGAWRPPYTIQYWNTLPFFYAIEQMARWTFWWPAFIAVAGSLVASLYIRRNSYISERWILLTWIVVSFLTIAGLQVKFPRYLLPIYPALCIFAAWGIDAAARWLSDRLPLMHQKPIWWTFNGLVLIPSICFAFAFRDIYNRPHTYEATSQWIFSHVPRGSTIVGFHWDDKIPLTLPGFSPFEYGYNFEQYELKIYELPDSTAKINEMAEVLAKADYLAWPTTRIPGSLPRIPDEYPRSLRLLQMLYTGELGFDLVYTHKDRPTLGGFEWRDDALDESFSVYDHPKAMVFKKVRPLSAGHITGMIENAIMARPLGYTREMFLNTDKNSPAPQPVSTESENGSPLTMLIWFLLLEILAFISWPFLAVLFRSSLDRGYLLSKTFGVLLFGMIAWALALMGAINLSASGLLLVVAFIWLTSLFVLMRTPMLKFELQDIIREKGFATEVLFFSVTLALMIIKSYQPEIFWGEKPMDFGLLNFFLRIDSLPPEDPWGAGQTMQYYYLGTFIVAMLIKLSGVPAAIGFNLGMIMVSTLVIMGVCAIISCFTRYTWLAISGSLLYFFSSNFEVIHLWFQNKIHSFDLFWASSRVLHSPAFAEYPLWSFLFGDLHAHVIAVPFTLLLIGLGISTLREWFNDEREPNLILAGLYGATLGTLYTINTWDCISYSIFSTLLFLATLLSNERRNAWLTYQERFTLLACRGAVAVLCMLIVIIPFYRTATSAVQLHWGAVDQIEFNSPEELFFFNGHWYLLLAIASICLVGAALSRYRNKISHPRIYLVAALTALPFVLTVLARLKGSDGTPWPGVLISSAIIFLSSVPLLFPIKQARILFFSIAGTSAGIILAASEVFFLFDRMNTIFKFYSALWTLLGVCAFGGLALFIEGNQRRPQFFIRRMEILIPPLLVMLPIFMLTLAGTTINLEAMTTFRRIEQVVRPTLDGMAYLTRFNPEELALYRWINRVIPGTPVLLEAQGESYREFTRVQMNTGLPVLLGWEHHVNQRGLSRTDIARRKGAIREIYSSPMGPRVNQLLQQYGVDLIVVGKIERENFSPQALEKFNAADSGFYKLFERGNTALYAAPQSKFNPQTRSGLERSPDL